MRNYIVDSCVWINSFSKGINPDAISDLYDNNNLYTNNVVLSEIIPTARKKNEQLLIQTISKAIKVPLSIDWDEVSEIKYLCIKNGINDIGLLDIAIAQNAKQNNMGVFSTDKHFKLLQKVYDFELKEQ